MNLDLSRWAAQLPENEQPGPECELDEFTAEEAVAVATTTAQPASSPVCKPESRTSGEK